MDSQPQETKDSTPTTKKLSSKAKEFTPSNKLSQNAKEFHPTVKPALQNTAPEGNFEEQAQAFDQSAHYYGWMKFYMDGGSNQEQAYYQYAAKFPELVGNLTGYEEYTTPYYGEEEMYEPYNQENYNQEEYSQADGPPLEEQKEAPSEDYQYGDKTKKPTGVTRKEKYQGKHHDDHDGSEEGYYDELGFYYLPDGSFYDLDGYYFNAQGYDKYGGYYDDNANYVAPEGQFRGKGGYRKNYQNYGYSFGAEDDYYEEEAEDKYTKEYIEYIIESKYYEDLEYLRNSQSQWAYLKVGNLVEGTTKQDLLKYFGNKGIETSQITIMMEGRQSPVARLEIYKNQVAVQVLKCCGDSFNHKQMMIEVDHENEKAYGNTNNYNEYEYGDHHDDRYTKYDEVEEANIEQPDFQEQAK